MAFLDFLEEQLPFLISSWKEVDISLKGKYVKESGDVFIFVIKHCGEEIWVFKVWAKTYGFLLNLGGSNYSNVKMSLKLMVVFSYLT